MKTKLLFVLLCVIFTTSCSNEDANFEEPTDALTYDDVRQKFLDAGFQLNVPRDSSATVIELHSPQEAMDFLNEYMVNKQLGSEISRAGIGTVIYFEMSKHPDGKITCSFSHNGLTVTFVMTNDFKVSENDPLRLEYTNKEYKIKRGGIQYWTYPILEVEFVKPITMIVNGEKFVGEDSIGFRFELHLGSGFAVVI